MGGARVSRRRFSCAGWQFPPDDAQDHGGIFRISRVSRLQPPVNIVWLPKPAGVEDYVPGAPYNYTSVFSLGGHASGLVVQTYEGRPTKIEGNPDHPTSMGAATALAQASLLGVYDPDRSKTVLDGGKDSSWDKFEAAVKGLSLRRWIGVAVLERERGFTDAGESSRGRIEEMAEGKVGRVRVSFPRERAERGRCWRSGKRSTFIRSSTKPKSFFRWITISWVPTIPRRSRPSCFRRTGMSIPRRILKKSAACMWWRASFH